MPKGLWNLHVDGNWYRWFHRSSADSPSPDAPSILKTVRKILSGNNNFKWGTVPFPTPLHFQLDFVYTVDRDAGYITVTRWRSVDGGLYPRAQRATLTSIRETSLGTLEALLEDVAEVPKYCNQSLSDAHAEVGVQHLLESFGIDPMVPAPLNELQFKVFTDFVLTWRFYLGEISTWERSFSLFSVLAIGLLRIAAWDLEIRNTDYKDITTFSFLPGWKAPTNDVFWFHGYLVVCCSSDEIRTSVSTKTRHFVSRSNGQAVAVHGIAISIRQVVLFEIRNGHMVYSPPIPLVTNDSSIHCSPGFRLLAYVFTSNHWKGSSERWGVPMPTELLEMIIKASAPRPKDLISMAQASMLLEQWYYSSILQVNGINIHQYPLSIPCCGKRHTSDTIGIYCSVCYAWFHTECAYPSSDMSSERIQYICSGCQESRPCAVLESGGIHQAYRAKRDRKGCSVVHDGKATDFHLRPCKPTRHFPDTWHMFGLAAPAPKRADYTIYFSGVFSGLAYGFD
ncbi:hypothetical protein P168DRAFT_305051 [Aspergillus campestris IBT 28561]|uniref:Uncharacterized protein n=1 Tax=Aspergillus campestris (strain IBT 28561) TaxID=1392248 RepID=A0A2I1D1G4_ASPC2|nr:uncharacterized protein P168DRAFT_305051 [Aspergillus campestris IBT 28561]PKY03715.1 hypothetical protein P168DRAFT_305051 [Aspergillus campestris IBT 28561]